MKNFKKIIIFIFLLLIIISIFFLLNKEISNSSKTTENKTTNSFISSTTNETNTHKSNFNGENAVIYLGTHSQYEPMTVVLEMPESQEKFIENVIAKISSLIGYTIAINSVTISDTNIYLDFSSQYAPFNIENSKIDSDEPLYSLYGSENIIYTIFDSIAKTLSSYFGNEYNIYFSVDSTNINISINDFNLKINSSTPYIINE